MTDKFLSTTEPPKLTQEDQELNCPFTQKEIEKAIFSLNSNKSPVEDGFPLEF